MAVFEDGIDDRFVQAAAVIGIGYILARRKGEKIGAIKERAEADLERVSELEEAGDSGGLRDDILKRLK